MDRGDVSDSGEYDEAIHGKAYDGTKNPVALADIDHQQLPATVLGAVTQDGHKIHSTNGELIVENS